MIARIPLRVRIARDGAVDDFGNPARDYADPVDVLAFSVGPAYSTERDQLVQTGLVVGLPHDYGITPQSLIEYRGRTYTVEGDLIDANAGPWDYRPGWVLNMRRAEQ